jgi:pimeloyl-ACP methyl ester carboxylesterase
MSATDQTTMHRTRSADGTQVAWFTSGEGPPLVLVHGGFGDHTRWNALRPHLEPHVTVHAMDRRGRGASADGPEYALEREFEDVAAVVERVARDSGGGIAVYGISFGGLCTLGATGLTDAVDRLVLYEGWPPVPLELRTPEGFIEETEALLARGDPEGALEASYRQLLGFGDEEIAHLKAQPEWTARVASAHTIPRELRTSDEVELRDDLLAPVTMPTLLLVGERGPRWDAERVARALPDARITVLEGQGHTADLFAPELVADRLLGFLGAA